MYKNNNNASLEFVFGNYNKQCFEQQRKYLLYIYIF